jgi:hypothetical protein
MHARGIFWEFGRAVYFHGIRRISRSVTGVEDALPGTGIGPSVAQDAGGGGFQRDTALGEVLARELSQSFA